MFRKVVCLKEVYIGYLSKWCLGQPSYLPFYVGGSFPFYITSTLIFNFAPGIIHT